METLEKYLFLDRDGTLIEEPADQQIDSVEKFKLLDRVIPSLIALKEAGYRFVMISNQDGLGKEKYPLEKFQQIQTLLLNTLSSQGISFEEILICPHEAQENCLCRKPKVTLVMPYLSLQTLDREKSFVIGDRDTDLELAKNMKMRGLKLTSSFGWSQVVLEILKQNRSSKVVRKTKETQIEVRVSLPPNPEESDKIQTGIGFFDHMLDQLRTHGAFGLKIQATGDLHIDDHHLIEDVGIAVGGALKKALGDKRGIERFGFYLPMDDASTRVALDLSGRSYFKFVGRFKRDTVGGLATEMVPHFFKSLSDGLGANLHIRMEGENTHHQVESVFKAVGRSLRSAVQQSSTRSFGLSEIPSTKGVL